MSKELQNKILELVEENTDIDGISSLHVGMLKVELELPGYVVNKNLAFMVYTGKITVYSIGNIEYIYKVNK